MKTVYQVESWLKKGEWSDDHLLFDSVEEAINYIKTQPNYLEYRIVSWEEPETNMETYDLIQALLKQLERDARTGNINSNYRKAISDAKDALTVLKKFY